MPLPTITKTDLENVDINTPLPIEMSPMAKEDPARAKLLQAKMGNPIEVQQYTATEFKIAVDQRVKEDMENLGKLSDKTMKWLIEMNTMLGEMHKNLYGSKSLNLNVQGKATHAQIASLMRQSEQEDVVVDVVPEPANDDVLPEVQE